tara:strand:+ start:344 stop:550 length:207 start_codon:yes stop_codon:yes gene_type:complete
MKNVLASVKNKMISRYIVRDETKSNIKSTDINVLLNRVRLDQKKESRKKLLFTAATSIGVILFGALIF